MFCTNCGNELTDGQKFCNKCGTKLVSEKTDEKKLDNTNTDFTIGKRHKESFSKNILTILIACGTTYFLFFLLFLFATGSSVPTFFTIMIVGLAILLCLCSIGAEVIIGKCPYCNSEISVPGHAVATDCPICQKRIMMKNDNFYKV